MSAVNFIALLILCLGFAAKGCPPIEDIAPFCKCRDFYGDNMMDCEGILSPDQLVAPIRSIAINNVKMFSLSINNSSLQYIPDGIFKDAFVEKIRFVSTQILSLSDSDAAFSGLENTLVEFRATDAHYVAQWDWQQLRELKRLDLIDINWITMSSIYEPFPLLPKLSALGIIRAEISFIVDEAFSNLPNLRILNMKQNDISDLKRNMFPDPAEQLRILDFSDNDISSLPEDFFDNMPNLADVYLDKNKFVTLPENPFSVVFRSLDELTLSENPFRCDCRMRWLVGIRTPNILNAECSSPESLNGVSISSLDFKSLWC